MFLDVQAAKQLITYLRENVDERCVVVMGDVLTVKAPPEVLEEVPDSWKGVYPVHVVTIEKPLSELGPDVVEELTEDDFIEFDEPDVQIEVEFEVET